MTVLGIIPARAGSQRLPGKNTALVGNNSLVAWAIIQARQSKVIDHLVVTTNDPAVESIANDYHCQCIRRPEKLAEASTPMLPAVRHACQEVPEGDEIILLQPTSPLRFPEDIRQAYDLYVNSGGDAVVSVTSPPNDLAFEVGFANRLRPAPKVMVPNGAIYIINREFLMTGGDWYSGISYAYQMPRERSVDVDTALDLELARMVFAQQVAA